DQAAPAGMQNNHVPQHDNQRAVFLRIPAPETTPGLIGPNASENRPDKTKQRREADDAIDHPSQRPGRWGLQCPRKNAADNIEDSQEPGEKGGRVTKRDHDDMSSE